MIDLEMGRNNCWGGAAVTEELQVSKAGPKSTFSVNVGERVVTYVCIRELHQGQGALRTQKTYR